MKKTIKDFGIIMKFKDHKYANCKVVVHAGYDTKTEKAELKDITLVSYTTAVLKYDAAKKELECYGLFSRTTRTHIGWFTKLLCGIDFYDAKDNVGGSIKNVKFKVGWKTALKEETNWLPYELVAVPSLLTEF